MTDLHDDKYIGPSKIAFWGKLPCLPICLKMRVQLTMCTVLTYLIILAKLALDGIWSIIFWKIPDVRFGIRNIRHAYIIADIFIVLYYKCIIYKNHLAWISEILFTPYGTCCFTGYGYFKHGQPENATLNMKNVVCSTMYFHEIWVHISCRHHKQFYSRLFSGKRRPSTVTCWFEQTFSA